MIKIFKSTSILMLPPVECRCICQCDNNPRDWRVGYRHGHLDGAGDGW